MKQFVIELFKLVALAFCLGVIYTLIVLVGTAVLT
jgi:UPF0716 family protein affecting phage T7 exclusion